MSFAKRYKNHAFYDLIAEAEKQGIERGAELERERIIKLLLDGWVRDENAPIINLIKGEQK